MGVMKRKGQAADAVKLYYTGGSIAFENESVRAVERVLTQTGHMNEAKRRDYDTVFKAVFADRHRNINAVSMEIFMSPSFIYKRMRELYSTVEKEFERQIQPVKGN